MEVVGKGSIKLKFNGVGHVISEVFYLPVLKNNLLSIGQFQDRDLEILIQNRICKIYHPTRGLIIEAPMSVNRMFALLAETETHDQTTPTCFKATSEEQADLWHRRYGHLHLKGLKTLSHKKMVNGLPSLDVSSKVCTICMIGKQHREKIPKKSLWRATQKLQLVHADICGPITPESNSQKSSNGISRQLTASYTPQQNGVAEQRNRTIMNMTRCMLSEMSVPKEFWPEAVNWCVHLLNRCPTLALKNKTPEEAWCGFKPSVNYFKVFGCIGHVHIPDKKRLKLDDKSVQCVFLGMSEESKAYRMYDPMSTKVIISRDVVFEEDKKWEWNKLVQGSSNVALEWGDGDEQQEYEEESVLDGDEHIEAVTNDSDSTSSEEANHRPPSPILGRERRPPVWMKDYVSGERLSDEEEINLCLLATSTDLMTFEEAIKNPKWREAMEQEIRAIEKNGTWELTSLPAGAKRIGVKWIFKIKLNEVGKVDKYKARLVAKGYTQQLGIDYTEVFAPVARWDTIRMILALAANKGWSVYQLDVKSAFLHGELVEDVFIDQPQGYEVKGEEDKVYKLKKALYGLKQAPRAWYSKLESYFIKAGFEKSHYEHTLFTKSKKGGKLLLVSVYVDDLIFTGNDEEMFETFKSSMKQEFDMSDLGKMKYFLGVEVLQGSNGIFINQKKYANEVLERFGMEHCNLVNSPIVPGSKLIKDEGGVVIDPTIYKQMVGSLMYLSATRPDLAYVLSLISRFMERPTNLHHQAVKRVLRYLKGTTEQGIFYKRSGEERLIAYSDSDYAGDIEGRKSTSGYVFLLSSGAVAWSSKKQPVVTLSTTEAEFIAAASCACQCVWMRRILEKLGHEQSKCTDIFCDNSSAIKLSKNPVMHGRSKHIDIRFHFLRDLTKDGVVKLEHCGSKDQLADLMTKPLGLEAFVRLRKWLGVCLPPSLN